MLINIELLHALRAAGADYETAAAAAAVLAEQERRLNRLEFVAQIVRRGLVACLAFAVFLLLIVLATHS
jgi:hypothetical protein